LKRIRLKELIKRYMPPSGLIEDMMVLGVYAPDCANAYRLGWAHRGDKDDRRGQCFEEAV
jgi:hypothetical protein